jgi:probable phosphoglycerate mutase
VTRLILVRHGESNVTVNRLIGGSRTCNGLSALGRLQAERLRDRWTERPEFEADVLISSNFARAIETAEIISGAFSGDARHFTHHPGFGEHDPGPDCDGMSFAAFTERYPDAVDWFEAGDPFASAFPGGETVAAFQFRVGNAVRQVIDQHTDKTIVISCHGGVIESLLRFALKAAPMGVFRVQPLNTSITELEVLKPNLWKLVRFADAAHLAGLPASTVPPQS